MTAVTPRSHTGQIAARQPRFWAAAGQQHRQLLSAPRCKQLLHLLLQEGGNKRDAARGQDEEQDSELQEGEKKKKRRRSFTHTLWDLPDLIRLRQVLPFHKEPEQLDIQIERHKEEGRLSGEQLGAEGRGEAGGDTPCLISGSTQEDRSPAQQLLVLLSMLQIPLCVGSPHCQEWGGSQGHPCLSMKLKGNFQQKN